MGLCAVPTGAFMKSLYRGDFTKSLEASQNLYKTLKGLHKALYKGAFSKFKASIAFANIGGSQSL